MSEHHRFLQLLRMPNGDRSLLLLTFGLTIFIDLTVAIAVGVTLASLLFMMRMSRTVEIASDSEGAASDAEEEELDQRTALPAGVEVFRIDGPIFFGVANDLMDTLRRIGSAPKIIILRMRRVPLLDASGVAAMGDIVDHAEVLGIRVILSGVTAQPMEMLERVSLGPSSSRVLHSANFADAVRLASSLTVEPASTAPTLH